LWSYFPKLIGKGVEVDVLGGKLLALAIKEAIDGQPNWEEFKARRKQALHDAMIIKTIFEKEQETHKVNYTSYSLIQVLIGQA